MANELKRISNPSATPSVTPNPAPSDQDLDYLSHLLDDFITIPGTSIRIGLDGIVGFIPGIGDVVAGLASTIIVVAAWKRGVPRIVLARMVANVAIETVVGALPIVGNFFDIAWRANRRNYKLLIAARREPDRRQVGSWLFIVGLCVVLLLLATLPFFFAASLFAWAKSTFHG